MPPIAGTVSWGPSSRQRLGPPDATPLSRHVSPPFTWLASQFSPAPEGPPGSVTTPAFKTHLLFTQGLLLGRRPQLGPGLTFKLVKELSGRIKEPTQVKLTEVIPAEQVDECIFFFPSHVAAEFHQLNAITSSTSFGLSLNGYRHYRLYVYIHITSVTLPSTLRLVFPSQATIPE